MSSATSNAEPRIPPCVLTIAGSDSGAGAGIQADLKTFAALGVYGASAITAITAQNTRGVVAVEAVSATLVRQQIEAVLADLPVAAIKLGMLGNGEIVRAVAGQLQAHPGLPVVLDPVMLSSSGKALLDADGVASLKRALIPRSTLITPNLAEAAALLGWSMEQVLADRPAATAGLLALGARAALLKGGHLTGALCEDLLNDGERLWRFSAPRLSVNNSHGTGCTLASAIAAGLSQGLALPEAVERAKAYLNAALAGADRFLLGEGAGSLDHFFRWHR